MTSCKRCEDIHTAQKDGKTQKECKCDCHNSGNILYNTSGATTTVFTNTNTLATLDTSTLTGNWINSSGDFTGSTIDFTGGNSAWIFGDQPCEKCGKNEDDCKCTKYKNFMDLPDGKTVPIWRIDHL